MIFTMEKGWKRICEPACVSYLWGKEGPTVGGRAAAACAVAVVRHRPLLAQRGTARYRFSCLILQTTTETAYSIIDEHRPEAEFTRNYRRTLNLIIIDIRKERHVAELRIHDHKQMVDYVYFLAIVVRSVNCIQRRHNCAATSQFGV